jgi:flagellar motility protein MotE (MotC chaperone)
MTMTNVRKEGVPNSKPNLTVEDFAGALKLLASANSVLETYNASNQENSLVTIDPILSRIQDRIQRSRFDVLGFFQLVKVGKEVDEAMKDVAWVNSRLNNLDHLVKHQKEEIKSIKDNSFKNCVLTGASAAFLASMITAYFLTNHQ